VKNHPSVLYVEKFSSEHKPNFFKGKKTLKKKKDFDETSQAAKMKPTELNSHIFIY
jgi:hypothetical protein